MSKPRKMLTDWDAPYIQSIVQVINTQSKTTLLKWALNYAQEVMLPIWEKLRPVDPRPLIAIMAARRWMDGQMKMTLAKKAIMDCQESAREAEYYPAAQAAARAMSSAAATIYLPRHCIGIVHYGALAVAYNKLGVHAAWEDLEKSAAEECSNILLRLLELSLENDPNPVKIDWTC